MSEPSAPAAPSNPEIEVARIAIIEAARTWRKTTDALIWRDACGTLMRAVDALVAAEKRADGVWPYDQADKAGNDGTHLRMLRLLMEDIAASPGALSPDLGQAIFITLGKIVGQRGRMPARVFDRLLNLMEALRDDITA